MISPQEAAQSLKDVRQTEQRSVQTYAYRIASSHLILWGLVWMIGYTATDFRPADVNLVWGVLVPAGVVAGFFLQGRGSAPRSGLQAWRFIGIALVMLLFIGSTMAVMGGPSGAKLGAFVPLLVAAIYAVMGLWLGMRFIVAGAAIAALTLGGYFFLPQHFALWMAFVGGGALILAGIWFRKV